MIHKEKVKTEKSRYARSLIEASLDPLFTISLKGKITDLNKASTDIIGKTRDEIIGSDFFGYFTEPLKAREVYKDVYRNGFVTDSPLTLKDDKKTDVLFNGSVYKDDKGKVVGVVVVARDITEQKRISNELTESIAFAEAATKIAEQAKRKAEKATRLAESAVKAKQQFLSNMSHEIRTPLNAIIGFTKVLLKTDLTAKQKEYLSAIKMSGDALIVLINDILDLAKVDSGKMTFEETPFKLSLSLSSMVHLFETKIREKNLQVFKEYDKKIPDVLVGDPVRLHQIIMNLVDNAVKFTNVGNITVRASLKKEDDKNATIEFSVADTGIGIPEEKLETIFENFQQASSKTSRLYGGTGLGLAIVKNLIEAQGGSIGVKSKVNTGTTFTFTLSFKKADSLFDSEEDLKVSDPDLENTKILVVEDILLNQLLMKTILDEFGFQREIAENGKVAVEMLKKNDYDLILMDLHMPVMNGYEATEYIRKKMKSDIPIIALTADVTTVDLAKCKQVGMNDYVSKPIDEKILYDKIASGLKRPGFQKNGKAKENKDTEDETSSCIDLDNLIQRTNSNPVIVMEMIRAYLDQTPPLIIEMNKSYGEHDWSKLHSAVHKMIPSFTIMGISKDFENIAKEVQEYASARKDSKGIADLLFQLSTVCTQACSELEVEFDRIKKSGL